MTVSHQTMPDLITARLDPPFSAYELHGLEMQTAGPGGDCRKKHVQ